MAPADALSRRDSIDTSLDNLDTAICLEPMVIGALDLTLARHITSSSTSNPLVLRMIENLRMGSPLFPCSSVKDWTYEGGHLYFKGRMYIPPDARHTLVSSLHSSPTLGHVGRSHTKTFLEHDFWWPGLTTYINKFIEGCAICQQKQSKHSPGLPTSKPDPLLNIPPL